MEFYEARNRLRRMGRENLLKLALKQEISRCPVGGVACNLYFRYEGFGFCASEILGQGCEVQSLKSPENCRKDTEEADSPPSVERRDEHKAPVGNPCLQYLTGFESPPPQRQEVLLPETKEPWKNKEPEASSQG